MADERLLYQFEAIHREVTCATIDSFHGSPVTGNRARFPVNDGHWRPDRDGIQIQPLPLIAETLANAPYRALQDVPLRREPAA